MSHSEIVPCRLLLDSQLALQVHESCGHPTELDRAIGYEAAYAGTSFLVPELIGTNFKYGNELVTMVADATVPGGLGTFFYDHEGVKAQRTIMVDKGIDKVRNKVLSVNRRSA